MKTPKVYSDAPPEIGEAIEQAEIIEDFLPPPNQLVVKEETVKVTLNLSKDSIAFEKKEAKALGVPYQNRRPVYTTLPVMCQGVLLFETEILFLAGVLNG